MAFAAASPAPAPAPAPAPKPAPGVLAAQPLFYSGYAPYNSYVGVGSVPYPYQPVITSYAAVPSYYKPAAYVAL